MYFGDEGIGSWVKVRDISSLVEPLKGEVFKMITYV